MTFPVRIILIVLLLCMLTGLAAAQSSVDANIHQVDSLYSAGFYSQAELEARRMLENDLLSDSLRIAAEQWVAFSLVAQGKTAMAKEHFLVILRLEPSHELDPVLTSPKILAVFNDARATYLATRVQASDSSLTTESRPAEGITFRTIVFPGWEQWYHGRTPVGPILVGAGVATLGSAITMAFLRKSAHEDYLAATNPDEIQSKYDTYNGYAKVEGYCFAAFAVVYLLSEIDVFTHASAISIAPAPAGSSSVAGGGLRIMYTIP
jgi:hypothetical protein